MINRMKIFSLSWIVAFGLAGMAHAQTFSDSFAGFGSNNKEPIEIEAANLQVRDNDKSAIFSGNVVVIQGDTKLETQRLIVFYSGSMANGDADGQAVQQSISRLEAKGNVLISSKDQVATGDDASFDMDKQLVVMTGKQVVLSQGPNVVVGKRLVINLETGKADLDANEGGPNTGRVKILLQPNSVDKKN
ncbi:LPS-assembly protein LptD [Pseudovibrio axinellae]|uniref:LPS-assembly protein LptD n=1 Tax=Pseudovibrio axinellae TaxID=989403 RepID=A0A165YZ73_9HYPH|nr:LptA/OstA family protein [Pseudovibrio axinellae]KZL19367.1 LPS-assembly protein LptD [Pseudovibrio axinellae]SEQ39435.1 lipopolysaccharide export system protein LptA [Pseudovibrio axinellae]